MRTGCFQTKFKSSVFTSAGKLFPVLAFLFSCLAALAADPSVPETPAAEAAPTQRWLLLALMALLLIIAGFYVRRSPPGTK
jgi:hypothetical protein